MWGALLCGIRERVEEGAGGSQIAVPGGGPAMRGGLAAFVPRGGILPEDLRNDYLDFETCKSLDLFLAKPHSESLNHLQRCAAAGFCHDMLSLFPDTFVANRVQKVVPGR